MAIRIGQDPFAEGILNLRGKHCAVRGCPDYAVMHESRCFDHLPVVVPTREVRIKRYRAYISEHPGQTLKQIAQGLGVHLRTVTYHLTDIAGDGNLRIEGRGFSGSPYRYYVNAD